MTYIPKNKIKSNQYSNGEYAYLDPLRPNNQGFEYFGTYYTLFNGKAFTGKYPGDGDNLPLIKRPIEGPTIDYIPPSLTTSSTPPLFPTDKDYEYGTFIRYFSKKRNEYLFEELTKDQYNTLNTNKNSKYFVYKPFFIKWMLTGDIQTVTDFNYYSIRKAEENEKVHGLNEFLKMNYTQYYK